MATGSCNCDPWLDRHAKQARENGWLICAHCNGRIDGNTDRAAIRKRFASVERRDFNASPCNAGDYCNDDYGD